MLVFIIVILVGCTLYKFFEDRKEQIEKIKQKGGLRKCYPILFQIFLNEKGCRIVIEKTDMILIVWQGIHTTAKFTFVQLLNNKLRISCSVKTSLYPVIRKNWEFSNNSDQEKMAITVLSSIVQKQEEYTDIVNKRIETLIDNHNFENDGNDFNNFKNDTVTDIDGNLYHTVTIGSQVWMVENLKTTRYRNGDVIHTAPLDIIKDDDIEKLRELCPGALAEIRNRLKPKFQWAYDRNENNVKTYGRLYTWYAATDSRNICPSGWRLPTLKDWMVLIRFLGGKAEAVCKLRETGTIHWKRTNNAANNISGFTALPGGICTNENEFSGIGSDCSFWVANDTDDLYDDEASTIDLFDNFMYPYQTIVEISDSDKTIGRSVRCLRDN